MSIVNIIKENAEKMGLAFRYGTDEELNQYSDNTPVPACFMSLLQTGSFVRVGVNRMRNNDVVLTIFDATSFNFDSEENEAILVKCEQLAGVFLDWLEEDNRLKVTSDVRFQRVYLRFAGVYTGVSIRFSARLNESDCSTWNDEEIKKAVKDIEDEYQI